jgi:hypothetical protein
MKAEEVVKDSVTWLTDPVDFHLASMDWFNDVADKQTTWPVCLLDNTIKERPVLSTTGVSYVAYDLTIFFLHDYEAGDQEDLNHDPEYGTPRHAAVDAMRAKAYELIDVMFRDSRIYKPTEDITGLEVTPVYNFLDENADGVQLLVTLKFPRAPIFCEKHSGPKP